MRENLLFQIYVIRTYSIQVSHPFCLTKGFRVRISGDTFKSFKLEHHLEELNEITVDGKITSKESKTLQENTILKEEFRTFLAVEHWEMLSTV